MKIKYFPGHEFQNESYRITMGHNEDLDPNEIMLCYQAQYKDINCVLVFSKIKELEVGMMLHMPKMFIKEENGLS